MYCLGTVPRNTDRQTDDSCMPIADHDWLKKKCSLRDKSLECQANSLMETSMTQDQQSNQEARDSQNVTADDLKYN